MFFPLVRKKSCCGRKEEKLPKSCQHLKMDPCMKFFLFLFLFRTCSVSPWRKSKSRRERLDECTRGLSSLPLTGRRPVTPGLSFCFRYRHPQLPRNNKAHKASFNSLLSRWGKSRRGERFIMRQSSGGLWDYIVCHNMSWNSPGTPSASPPPPPNKQQKQSKNNITCVLYACCRRGSTFIVVGRD